jgi:hypothetical protein
LIESNMFSSVLSLCFCVLCLFSVFSGSLDCQFLITSSVFSNVKYSFTIYTKNCWSHSQKWECLILSWTAQFMTQIWTGIIKRRYQIWCARRVSMPTGKSEAINRRLTDNAMTKRKRTKEQAMIYKTWHRKLKIGQHEPR